MQYETARVIVLSLAAVVALTGQEYRGRIQGLVADPTKAVMPGVTVQLKNIDTDAVATRDTDEYGRYLFDQIEPGRYSLAAEKQGFARFVQENILVQNRGDITVNPVLQLGGVSQTVTISEAPVSVQFNTSSMDLTVDNTMVRNLPVMGRNPFTLALLDPAVVNRYTLERTPFKMWASSQLEVGGPTSQKNDTLLDGMPVQAGPKGTYSPPMDAVSEVSVQQTALTPSTATAPAAC